MTKCSEMHCLGPYTSTSTEHTPRERFPFGAVSSCHLDAVSGQPICPQAGGRGRGSTVGVNTSTSWQSGERRRDAYKKPPSGGQKGREAFGSVWHTLRQPDVYRFLILQAQVLQGMPGRHHSPRRFWVET